jgi:hypothetical protein
MWNARSSMANNVTYGKNVIYASSKLIRDSALHFA